MKYLLATTFILSISSFAYASDTPKFYVPDADDSDVPIVCTDKHGAKIFYDDGQTLTQGYDLYDLNEIFERSSDSGDNSHSKITPRNADAFEECDMDLDEIDF